MTVTASKARRNIAVLEPVIDYRRNPDNSFDLQGTAEAFVDNNLRHTINRRIPWRNSGCFVHFAVKRLVQSVRGGTFPLTEGELPIEARDVIGLTQDLLNGRCAWLDKSTSACHAGSRTLLIEAVCKLLRSL